MPGSEVRISDAEHQGRPRVFGVTARAIPLSDGGGSLLERGIDVALLMTPSTHEPFVIRAPRGTLGAGRRFVLRCPGLERQRGALARTTGVSELGLGFDLVTAEMVHAPAVLEQAAASILRRDPLTPAPDGDSQAPAEQAPPRRLQQRASATAVELDGIATIATELSVVLQSWLRMGEPVKLTAARGELAPHVYFSLRYLDASGAQRALLRVETVVAQAGMVDEIVATLLRPVTRAEERQSYRVAYEVFFTAEVDGPNGARSVRGGTIDLSASGLGFRASSHLAPGDRLRISDPTLPDLDGRELVVVRRDSRDEQRYGARFLEPNGGAHAFTTVVGLDRAEREQQRRRQIELVRRARQATATPLTSSDVRSIENRRMGTRSHGDGPGNHDV